jgi:hypothetical protein
VANSRQSWHLLGPVTRFQSRSAKVVYEIAQVTLIVENRSPQSEGVDREGIVVYAQDEVGSKKTLEAADVNKQQNIQIKSHMTPSGLLFATLSLDSPSFEEFFAGLEELTNKVDFTKLPHRRSISYEGRFNWKTMYRLILVLMPSGCREIPSVAC